MKTLFLILLSIANVNAYAADANLDCRAVEWKLDRNLSLEAINAELNKLPRSALVQLAWGEMLRANAKTSLSLPVLQYLEGTEQSRILRGYYQFLGMTVTDEQSPRFYLKKWPARPVEARTTALSLKDLCSFYGIALKN